MVSYPGGWSRCESDRFRRGLDFLKLWHMTLNASTLSGTRGSALHSAPHPASSPNHEQVELVARGLPQELAFLAAGGFSPEVLVEALGGTTTSSRPLNRLLSDGKITEEAYYQALASHLGCMYYSGDPPLAGSFDAVKGLRCGIGTLEPEDASRRSNSDCAPCRACSAAH